MSESTEMQVAALLLRGFPDTTQALQWLEERVENCIRLGDTKDGDERAGWAEDAAYFAKAIAIIRTLAGLPPDTKH